MTGPDFDVVVIGGGVPGLAFVSLLERLVARRHPLIRIAVVEAHPPEPLSSDAPTGLRVFALGPGTTSILETCGVWDALLPDRAAPYERMRVWQMGGTPFGPGSIGFDAAETGRPALGHVVEHDGLRLALWRSLAAGAEQRTGPARIFAGKPPESLRILPEHAEVVLGSGEIISTRLVVGADGVNSWVRGQLGLNATSRHYRQSAIVAHVSSEHPHQHTAWQRFIRGGPVALLPLADGRSSIVWSAPDADVGELLTLADEGFSDRVTEASGRVLGSLKVTTARLAVPLAASHTHRYTGERFALIGDAAHQIHPLAGQGANLGLLDAAALAETLADHLTRFKLADPGDARVLRSYERWRKGGNLLTMAAMDGLHGLFTSPVPGVTRLATAGLGLVDRLPLVKRLLAEQATGQAGRTPRSAQERYARI